MGEYGKAVSQADSFVGKVAELSVFGTEASRDCEIAIGLINLLISEARVIAVRSAAAAARA